MLWIHKKIGKDAQYVRIGKKRYNYFCQYKKVWKRQDTLIKIFDNIFDTYLKRWYYNYMKGATDRRLAQYMN